MWKEVGPSQKVRRALRAKARAGDRDDAKAEVRKRDKGCRVPFCGCRRLRLRLEVSHKKHQGAGGNPAGDRNDPRNLMLVCAERHKDNPISIDRGSLKWEPYYVEKGANSAVTWLIDYALFSYLIGESKQRPTTPEWMELATERAPGSWFPLSVGQDFIVRKLATMEF